MSPSIAQTAFKVIDFERRNCVSSDICSQQFSQKIADYKYRDNIIYQQESRKQKAEVMLSQIYMDLKLSEF